MIAVDDIAPMDASVDDKAKTAVYESLRSARCAI
jgi:hypothetical protein